MKIHEYQARVLLSQYGIESTECQLAETPEQAADIAAKMGGLVVIKAQVLVGGRGKAGGVKLAKTPQDAARVARDILAISIKDIPVNKVLVARAADILQEFYMGITVDRAMKKAVLMISAAGGVEIEELAKTDPDKILKIYVDPLKGPSEGELKKALAEAFGEPKLAA
ncbi:MAG: ATP-grasp domain-containing protein [Candidatus Omnitrophota bacterium]